MFAQPPSLKRRWNVSLAVSFIVHCVVIYALVRPPRPVFITPSSVAFGHGGTSAALIYFSPRTSTDNPAIAPEKRPLTVHAKTQPRPPAAPPAASAAERAGTPFGSLAQGPATGHDVRPALPVVYPNPDVLPWQIPSGVEGNVIVEITIDAQGIVTETKVLQALGHGIEDKVVAALRNWRFRPATIDGRAIPSQQDVYFHFPS